MTAGTLETPESLRPLRERIAEWVDHRANPMLVKDVRGLLRNRGFLFIFFLGMVLAQLITFIFTIIAGDNSSAGSNLFEGIMMGLSVLAGVIVPYMVHTKFHGELKSKATELALISRLTPAVLIRGKIQSSMAASLVLFAAAAPSLAIGYMLGGIDIFTATLAIILLLLLSFSAAVLMTFLVTLGQGIIVRGLALIGTLNGLWSFPVMTYAFIYESRRGNFLQDDDFWVPLLLFLPGGLMTSYFFYTVAVAKISSINTNR
ncbi:MAG: hypothetical protein ACYTGH_12820, partial [Planctomycetota bacterium]